jgi:two-component system, LytTR family, response regulator
MKKIRSVIVEDELAAREVLKNYLSKYCPQVEVIGEAQNIKEAVPMLHELQPELVFLDVEMPFGNAFDVLEACKELQFETIFVTAFSEYSLKALNQSAAYYLLKPISIEELIIAVNKVHEHLLNHEIFNRNKIIVENFRETKPEKQQVILPTLEGFEVVKMEEIVRLRGNGNFTDIYLSNGNKKMVCRFLKHFAEILPHPFIRVHKSHIINSNCVKSYNKGGTLTLDDGSEIEVSLTYKDDFLKGFK